MTGAFVAVVGPSGAGKDAVIGAARDALDPADFLFPRRSITRPSGTGEDHHPLTESEFAAAEARGDFVLAWRAHGLAYGISASVRDAVDAGAIAVTNVSRTVLSSLGATFAHPYTVRITVSERTRLERIVSRGREDTDAAVRRARRPDPAPNHPVDLEITNDGPLDDAAAELVDFLTRVRRAHRPRVHV